MGAAAKFAQDHAIQHDELATIIDFILHAEQTVPPATNEKADEKPMNDVVEAAVNDVVEDDVMEEIPMEPENCKRQRVKSEEDAAAPLRFAFPVMLEDGGELFMGWTRGQDLEDVSKSFAQQHGLPAEAIPQLLE